MLPAKIHSILPGCPSCGNESKTVKLNEQTVYIAIGQGNDECSSLIVRRSRQNQDEDENFQRSSSLNDGSPGEYGTLGSMSLAINFLTGPAMLEIPSLFQKSGLIPTILCIVFVCGATILGNLYFANAISKLSGNYDFGKEIQYSEAFRLYWPNNSKWYRSTELMFFLCVTCLTVSSLVDSAQVFDIMLVKGGILGGNTYALRFVTTSEGFSCFYEGWNSDHCLSKEDCTPFSDHEDEGGMLLSTGYLLNVMFFMPLALLNLQENAVWQVIEFIVLIITTIMFSLLFISNGIEWEGRLSLWGESWGSLIGVILFNFALVISIPAWLYEKGKNS